MFQLFNTNSLSQQQRFVKALIVSVVATLVMSVVLGLIMKAVGMQLSLAYLAVGYGLGRLVQYFGRGVQVRFSVLAAVSCLVCILLTGYIAAFGLNILNLAAWKLYFLIYSYLFTGEISSIISLLYRVAAVYLAYRYARVVH